MSEVVDLDALMPQPAIVKFGGQEVKIDPPKVSDLMILSEASGKLENISGMPQEELDKVIDELTRQIWKCAPPLADTQFSLTQLRAIIGIFMDMVLPPEKKELEKRGITPDSPKV